MKQVLITQYLADSKKPATGGAATEGGVRKRGRPPKRKRESEADNETLDETKAGDAADCSLESVTPIEKKSAAGAVPKSPAGKQNLPLTTSTPEIKLESTKSKRGRPKKSEQSSPAKIPVPDPEPEPELEFEPEISSPQKKKRKKDKEDSGSPTPPKPKKAIEVNVKKESPLKSKGKKPSPVNVKGRASKSEPLLQKIIGKSKSKLSQSDAGAVAAIVKARTVKALGISRGKSKSKGIGKSDVSEMEVEDVPEVRQLGRKKSGRLSQSQSQIQSQPKVGSPAKSVLAAVVTTEALVVQKGKNVKVKVKGGKKSGKAKEESVTMPPPTPVQLGKDKKSKKSKGKGEMPVVVPPVVAAGAKKKTPKTPNAANAQRPKVQKEKTPKGSLKLKSKVLQLKTKNSTKASVSDEEDDWSDIEGEADRTTVKGKFVLI
jgi:hypothetical protein